MNRAYSVSLADECPVAPGVLARLYRAEAETLPDLLADIPLARRAELAAFLYGRSHTRELGIQVAAACDRLSLWNAAGRLGEALHELAGEPVVPSTYGIRTVTLKRVSLADSSRAA